MAITQSLFPTLRYEGKDWAGLTTENNLGYLFGEKPQDVTKFIDTIYQVSLQDDLVSKMNQYPIGYLDDDTEYEWKLMGADGKNIPLISATDLAGNSFSASSTPGKYGEQFYMYFGEKLFFQTHVIVGNNPDLYHLLVKDEPVQIGTNFRIKVELVTSDPELYIPYTELAAGTRWSADYSLAEQTLSATGSDISFTAPFKMANRISMLRKKHLVPGNMILKGKNSPAVFDWQVSNANGSVQRHTTWINRLDWEFDKEFRREKARLLMFGKSNKRADGTYGNVGQSQYEIKAGMGLREQISPSNRFYYNTFNIETLVDFALSLSVGKIKEDQRNFVIGTGEYGLKMISRAIERYAGANALAYGTENNRMNTIVAGSKGSYNRPQFVKFADINGLRFEFMHIPEYDDPIRNKIYHPDGGLLESYRLTIMDFGTASGQPNIQLMRIKGQEEVFKYIPGMRDPYSAGGKGRASMAVTSIDGYEIHRQDWCGVKVHRPDRLGEFIMNYV